MTVRMSKPTSIRRRRFIGAAVTAAAAPLVSCGGSGSRFRFFTADQARTLGAVCEQIIPADQDPGAGEAGVVNFIDRQLGRKYREYRQAYQEGIAAIDRAAVAVSGARFADLPFGRQREVLAAIDKNQQPGKAFFDLAVTHTMQGFYGDPRHGGNRDRASWKMLGIPHPPVRGRFRYPEEKA
jgi:gluconate 2-dehydrogenase gamma chain